MLSTSIGLKITAAVSAALVGAGALAVSGNLPESAQRVAADVGTTVGLELPGSGQPGVTDRTDGHEQPSGSVDVDLDAGVRLGD